MALCYKDMLFCHSDCVNTDCFRKYTRQVREEARAWWSHDPNNAPVAFSDFSSRCVAYTPPSVQQKGD